MIQMLDDRMQKQIIDEMEDIEKQIRLTPYFDRMKQIKT